MTGSGYSLLFRRDLNGAVGSVMQYHWSTCAGDAIYHVGTCHALAWIFSVFEVSEERRPKMSQPFLEVFGALYFVRIASTPTAAVKPSLIRSSKMPERHATSGGKGSRYPTVTVPHTSRETCSGPSLVSGQLIPKSPSHAIQ